MMMADSVEGEGSNAGGSGEQERPSLTASARAAFKRGWDDGYALSQAAFTPVSQHRADQASRAAYGQAREAYDDARAAYAHARAYDYALTYAHVRAYVSLAVKASGLLALLLSMVILLGGYVQSLGKKDFFCIMGISVIQAAGIFQDWENNLQYLNDFWLIFVVLLHKLILMMNFSVKGILVTYIAAPVVLPCMVLIDCIIWFYMLGPLACAAISSWRIAKLNHDYIRDGTNSMADMMATLNIFYSLIIFQGTMFGVLLLPMKIYRAIVASALHSLEQLPEKWSKDAIWRYLFHISKRCRNDPISIQGMDLIKYAAELLDSESQEDYLYGVRLLSAFIKKRKDVRWLLLPTRNRIQRLIDSLWTSSGSLDDENIEIRELAATIVADLAGHIDVARYPGALPYISSLLREETKNTETHWNSSKQVTHPRPAQLLLSLKIFFQSEEEQLQNLTRREEERQWRLMRDQNRLGIINQERCRRHKSQRGTSNELVQQGLTILERLASNNDDNRRLICGTPGLLPKITAPIYSETFSQDVKTKAWADIVTRCLKVLHQLIRAPGWASRRLRHEIFSDDHALSNLKSILRLDSNNEAHHQELQLVAMEILTELGLDLSINLTDEIKKGLIKNQLQLFLPANGDGKEESATIAGRAMVSLSTNSVSNSALIKTTQNNIIFRLTGILDDENITRRTIAALIMANLWAHCTVENMKEILPKVLRKIMSIKTKSQETQNSADQNPPAPALEDLEKQGNSVSTKNTEERHNISTQGDDIETEEFSYQEREEQEAFLSLAQVICNRLNSADLDNAIQSAVQENNNAARAEQRRETFVVKLKMIIDDNCHPAADSIDDNCHPAADSLRIVKLCGQIATSVMRCQDYVQIFGNKGFKGSLSKASETMSELESCMLFVGADFGLKKTIRPLISEIEKAWPDM